MDPLPTSQRQYVVTLVLGTFAQNSTWTNPATTQLVTEIKVFKEDCKKRYTFTQGLWDKKEVVDTLSTLRMDFAQQLPRGSSSQQKDSDAKPVIVEPVA
jgi:hypothetical protein